ncbi:hypothetical protein [Amycolatopsis magusensis]|uniref:hypothetical protein n=1 Tax=Amycolatopsis magusensis TaxID=882444 RepID=UPI0024A84D1E|nr:hypothetical protein [Amycolatopsis magusensis]MDI5976275.1 hypothetical protein [Amycolatopsis magusensis]
MTSSARPSTLTPQRQPGLLSGALTCGVLGALLLAAGGVLPAVGDAHPGYSSALPLIVLALLPAAAAVFAVAGKRPTLAAGVLAGAAVLAPGRLLLDLQLLVDLSNAARPELHVPTQLEAGTPGVGLWLLLAGHVLTAAAGIAAVQFTRREAEAEGTDLPGGPRLVVLAIGLTVVAGVGLVMAPFESADPYLPARNAFESPWPVLTGGLLLAFAMPLGAALAFGSGLRAAARGSVLGLAFAVLAVAVPNLIAGFAVKDAGVSAGPVVAIVAALGLAALAIARQEGTQLNEDPDVAEEAKLPGRRRLELATGVLAVLTAAAAVLGGLTAQVTSSSPAIDAPKSPAALLLVVAGILLGVLGLAMLLPGIGETLRPALSVAWVVVPLAGTAVLDTVLTASRFGGVLSPGAGVTWTSVALFAAVVTGICSAVAGMVERENDDGRRPASSATTPVVAAGVLAVAAFVVPVVTAPDYDPPTLITGFGASWWGAVIAVVAVLVALGLALYSRPMRAFALLLGVFLVLVLRAAEFPLVGGELDGSAIGIGLWLSIAAAIATGIAAGFVTRAAEEKP